MLKLETHHKSVYLSNPMEDTISRLVWRGFQITKLESGRVTLQRQGSELVVTEAKLIKVCGSVPAALEALDD